MNVSETNESEVLLQILEKIQDKLEHGVTAYAV